MRAKRALARRDAVLARIIRDHPRIALEPRGEPFFTLARSIVGQQISVKAAASIWARVVALAPRMLPDQVVDAGGAELVEVRGIGRWTAEMFLMFGLLRPNVLPLDDLGLQRAICLNYFRGRPVSLRTMRKIAEGWDPWRSVATWYLWRSLDPIPVEY